MCTANCSMSFYQFGTPDVLDASRGVFILFAVFGLFGRFSEELCSLTARDFFSIAEKVKVQDRQTRSFTERRFVSVSY